MIFREPSNKEGSRPHMPPTLQNVKNSQGVALAIPPGHDALPPLGILPQFRGTLAAGMPGPGFNRIKHRYMALLATAKARPAFNPDFPSSW